MNTNRAAGRAAVGARLTMVLLWSERHPGPGETDTEALRAVIDRNAAIKRSSS